MDLPTVQFFWYLVVGLAMILYTLLDGFDLGVGILLPFTKKDQDRRIFLNAIGPVWDGNEVWLVIIIGALFAGFPNVYSALLSGFYNLIMLLLVGLIFRAAAIEFRSKLPSLKWRFFWDNVFFLASLVVAFLYGVGLGNLIQGVPVDAQQEFIGSFSGLFNPYAIFVGLLSVALFTTHGAAYLMMKTEGELQNTVWKWLIPILLFFFTTYLLTTFYTFLQLPYMLQPFRKEPWLILLPLFSIYAMINIAVQAFRRKVGWTFISSCLCLLFLLLLFGVGTFPLLVRSSLSPENSLTIYNSSSSAYTLKVLLTIVLIGIPLVLGYGFWVYRIFRGKVKLDTSSY